MNDSLRTDVFVRYAPETIATACIYLSARKLKVILFQIYGTIVVDKTILCKIWCTIIVNIIFIDTKVPLPKNPSWFDVLGVEEDDIKDCCYRIMCLYDRKKVCLNIKAHILKTFKTRLNSVSLPLYLWIFVNANF